MKRFYLLLFLSFLFFMGCGKDKSPDRELSITMQELKQTAWKGTLLYSGSGETNRIGIFFDSEETGAYEVISSLVSGEPLVESESFTYSVNGKSLYIKPARSYFLRGHWLLIEKTNEKLVFKLYPESEDAFVITLIKAE